MDNLQIHTMLTICKHFNMNGNQSNVDGQADLCKISVVVALMFPGLPLNQFMKIDTLGNALLLLILAQSVAAT